MASRFVKLLIVVSVIFAVFLLSVYLGKKLTTKPESLTRSQSLELNDHTVIVNTSDKSQDQQKIIRLRDLSVSLIEEHDQVAKLILNSAANDELDKKQYVLYARGMAVLTQVGVVSAADLSKHLSASDKINVNVFYVPSESGLSNSDILDDAREKYANDEGKLEQLLFYYGEYGKKKPSEPEIATLLSQDIVELPSDSFLVSDIELIGQ